MDRKRVLVVCTGNICRSPFAAAVLQDRFDSQRPGAISVTSAGTHALIGHTIAPESAIQLDALGLSADDFVARQTAEGSLANSDLILTMTQDQKRHLLELHPRGLRRTFTVLELASLLDLTVTRSTATDWSDRWHERIALSAANRSLASLSMGGAAGDVKDPYRLPLEAYEEMVAKLLPALDIIRELAR